MSHHLHLDTCEHGHQHIHCLRCGTNHVNAIPAEPCPRPEVAVLCELEGREADVSIELHPEVAP